MIPYARQSVDEDDIAAVTSVLRGDWLTQGPHVGEFEAALSERLSARFAVAFSSGTAALHAATAVADLGPGDVVVTSPLSFVASASCIRYVGATPAFVDIESETLNLDPTRVPGDAAGLVAVHYAGLPVALDRVRNRPRVVIEDATHALGAATPDGPVGNCAHSDMCAFSFHPAKVITSGEGGAITTNDAGLARRLREFRSHCAVRKPEHGGWYYEIERVGYNYRLTDIQAALAAAQLAKLDVFVARRQDIARRYREQLSGMPLELPPGPAPGYSHAHHLFPVRLSDRRSVYDGLHEAGIGVQVHYVPIYRHPAYRFFGDPRDFPNTELAYDSLLSLPLFPALTDAEQDRVSEALGRLL